MIRIYGMADPRTPAECRYVGQTSGRLRARLLKHISAARYQVKTKVNAWVAELAEQGLEPIIVELESVSDDELARAEKYWIAHYRELGHRLLNMTTGGQTRARKYETEEEAQAAWRTQNTEAAERWRRRQGMRSNEERRMSPEDRRQARVDAAKRWRDKQRG